MIYKNLFARKIISFLIISAMILILFPRIPVSADTNLGMGASGVSNTSNIRNFNGHSYLIVSEKTTPVEAEKICRDMGGYLVTITSQQENEFLKKFFSDINDDGYILGGTDREVEGQWQWMNGEPWTFENWNSPPEPNDGLGRGEDYVFAGRHVDWKWIDFFGGYDGNSSKSAFVCEFDAIITGLDQNTQTPPMLQNTNALDIRHFNGHSYLIVNDKETPVEAEKKCLAMGGYLVTVNSQEENEFLKKIFDEKKEEGYILGGSDREVEGQWKWMTGEPWNFEYWNSGIEPNDGLGKGEDYVFAARNVGWKWVDFFGGYDNYSSKFAYICEFNTMIDGAGQNMQTPQNPPKPQIPQNPKNAMPTPNNAVPVPVESKNGANPTLVFNGVTGVSINSPINRGYLGYRVFRSENEYDLGISVTDFYITSENFTDVNVEPNTTYYYTLKPVISEANPLQNKKEQLGDAIAKWRVTTANSLGTNFGNSNGMRHFIMLKINDPKMSVDGVMQEVDPGKGTTPIIVKGRTMVPIRAIVEAMGGNVGWENSRREVSLSVQGIDVKMWIDKKELIKNSRHTKIDVAPSVINGRTFVPLRFAAENLDCQVDWINSTKSVVIVWSE